MKLQYYISTVLLLLSLSAAAQKPVPVDTLPFAHFENDTLAFDPVTSNLTDFYRRMDQVIATGKGNINILHIGGSHVQAGTMSHCIRRNLLNDFPNRVARRGMIFPYSVAPKCNNPADYRVSKNVTFSLIRNVYKDIDRPLGVTGIAVYTSDTTAQIKIRLNTPELAFPTHRIILLGYPDSSWALDYDVRVVPSITIGEDEYYPSEIDTNTRRYVYDVPTMKDSFLLKINNYDRTTFTLTGILLDDDAPGLTFHSIGVNGAQVSSYLKCVNFEEDLQLIRPDLVIFGIGINDAAAAGFDTVAFKNNYLELVRRIRTVSPDCAFIFLTNNDSYKKIKKKYSVNHNGELARDVFYRLAAETGGAVWDQFDIMGGLRSMDKWRTSGYAQYDRVHFTVKGYNLIGDLFYNAFIDAWEKCRNINQNQD